jgi:DNA replication and repair protein RecF
LRVTELHAQHFRNLEPVSLSVQGQFVVLYGPNAQGKTNALEAVHLLATLKPIRGHRLRELVQFGAPAARVSARVEHHHVERLLRVDLEASNRKVSLDSKPASDLGEYFASIRAITFTPGEGEIVSGEPARRRNWIDRAVFTQSPGHLERVRSVRRVLDQKAALLRADRPDRDLLEVLDSELARHGADLSERRARMLAELLPHAIALHQQIATPTELTSTAGAPVLPSDTLSLTLRTHADGRTLAERTAALAAQLSEARPRELARKTTLAGPQLDDVRISIGGKAARDFASRGQIRSVVLALKLAEMVAARQRDLVPIFLIDDVSSELDSERTAQLVSILAELGAQVFATTTDPTPLFRVLPSGVTQGLRVEAGRLYPR